MDTGRREGSIDIFLPRHDVRSSHEIEVAASAADVYRAVKSLDMGRSLPVMALFAVRAIPHLLTGKARPSRSLTLNTMTDLGFTVLADDASGQLVMGSVGKFWRLDSGMIRVSAEEFVEFDEPGYAKGAMAFTVASLGPDRSLLATETRVACTDVASRRKFALYWRVIGPFSGAIRHMLLAQIKRAAETSNQR